MRDLITIWVQLASRPATPTAKVYPISHNNGAIRRVARPPQEAGKSPAWLPKLQAIPTRILLIQSRRRRVQVDTCVGNN